MLKKSTIVVVLLSMIALLSVSLIGITASQPPYDPWLDNTDDGYGGIDDIVATAEHFGASGDPIKQCNITNWPTHTEITVFWQEYAAPSSGIGSDWYEAYGFGTIHLIVRAWGLMGVESVEIWIHGRIRNLTTMAYFPLIYYTLTLTPTTTYRFLTLPVPCESFNFAIVTDSASDCEVSLSFYLTMA